MLFTVPNAKIIVGDHIGQCFQGQATFPNMECMAMLNEKTKKIGKIIKTIGMVFTFDDDVWSAVFKIQCAFPNMDRRACLNERLYIHLSMKIRRE